MNKNKRSGGASRCVGQIAVILCMAGAAALIARLAIAQPADAPGASPAPSPDASEPVDVEVFQEARVLSVPQQNSYPSNELYDGHEGWVALNMMIDPKGKPYEVMVVDSSGNPAFEQAALKMVDRASFAPAHRGNTAVDSSLVFKVKFTLYEPAKGASPKFIRNYEKLTKAIAAADKATADTLLPMLNGENLYEEAFEHYGRYYYSQRWGTPADQLKELGLAVAGEKRPGYLPREAFVDALSSMFALQGKARDYGGALATWTLLKPFAPQAQRAIFTKAVDQIKALQQTSEPLQYVAEIGERGDFVGTLFRNRFSLDVTSGTVNEIKLRCAKQYLFFKYQPGVEYSIGKAKDQCGIDILGRPGTKFVLNQ